MVRGPSASSSRRARAEELSESVAVRVVPLTVRFSAEASPSRAGSAASAVGRLRPFTQLSTVSWDAPPAKR